MSWAGVLTFRSWEVGGAAASLRYTRQIDQASDDSLAAVGELISIPRVEKVGMQIVALAGAIAQDLRRFAMRGWHAARLGDYCLDAADQIGIVLRCTKLVPGRLRRIKPWKPASS